jgi:hypothetical protein
VHGIVNNLEKICNKTGLILHQKECLCPSLGQPATAFRCCDAAPSACTALKASGVGMLQGMIFVPQIVGNPCVIAAKILLNG